MALNEVSILATEMEKVTPKVEPLYDKEDTFYSQLEKAPTEVISGRDMRVPLALRPGGYFGHYDPDGGDLGVGDGPSYDKAVINTVNLRYAVQWTKKAEWVTDDSRKAVINTFRELMANAMPEFRRNSDSLCMTSGNGVLGTITSVSTASGVDTYVMTTDGYGARLLRYGLKINVYDATLATQRTSGGESKITFYDLANKTIKVTPAVTGAVATDLVVVSGVSGASPVSLYGVPYHNNSSTSGTWLGLTRSTTPEIVGNSVTASGTLALPYPRLALNKIGDRIGRDAKQTPEAWMHPCQVQAYEQLGQLVSIIQKQAKTEGLDMYFSETGMQMAGASIRTSYSWDKKRIDFIIKELWARAEMHKPGFYEVDGRKIFEIRGASGGVATSQVFYIVASWNMYEKNPAGGSYISSLTVPTGY